MLKPYASFPHGVIYHGDAKEIMQELPDETFSMILTDPPYPKKYFHTYEILGDYSHLILKDGGSLFTITPHYSLPDVIQVLSKHLKYRWVFNMYQIDGNHPRMAMGIEVTWKPVLWYVKRAYPQGRGFIVDSFTVHQPKKKYHKWEQSEDWARFFLTKHVFSHTDLVLDPFFGAGTVGVVAEQLGVNWVGIELDEKTCEIAAKRLDESLKQS